MSVGSVLGVLLSASTNVPADPHQFYLAIRANDLAQVRALAVTDPNSRGERDVTPLMNAAAFGSLEAMRLLLDAGADANAKSEIGSTALMWSVSDIDKVRLLLAHGADVNVRSEHGRTAVFLAAMSDESAAIVRLLLDHGAKTDTVDDIGMTLLHAATIGGDVETIRTVIEAGAGVNAADIARYTPLMNAAQRGLLPAVTLLIAKGANVNAVSDRGDIQTHANKGVKNGLLALGRFTALLLASATSQVDVMQALIDAGADVNAADIRGMTPLMSAVASDHAKPEAIRLLLAHHADLDRKSDAGETALDWARKFGGTPIVRLLEAAGAKGSTPERAAIAPAAPLPLQAGLARSLRLLETTSGDYFSRGGCAACHAQNITDVAVAAARTRGIATDADLAAKRLEATTGRFVSAAPVLLERFDAPGTPDVPLYTLYALASRGYPGDAMTDGMVANIAAQQLADGRWFLGGVARAPIQDGDITRTALAIRALKVYGPPARAAEMSARIARAASWLASAPATTMQDRNMQLLGLFWAGTDRRQLRTMSSAIVAKQRSDGGWAQRDELPSDAYATGQTLVALSETAATAASDPVVGRGVRYLLSTQRADGSWFVPSRSPKFQPYFDSGFPYGQDQWISSMATGWAAAALAKTTRAAAPTHH